MNYNCYCISLTYMGNSGYVIPVGSASEIVNFDTAFQTQELVDLHIIYVQCDTRFNTLTMETNSTKKFDTHFW